MQCFDNSRFDIQGAQRLWMVVIIVGEVAPRFRRCNFPYMSKGLSFLDVKAILEDVEEAVGG